MIPLTAKRVLRKLGGNKESKKILSAVLVDGQYSQEGRALNLVTGQHYTVCLGGAVYECECVKFGDGYALGNLSFGGGGDENNSGEPFLIGELFDEGAWGTFAMATNGETNISVSTETIHPIDPKYLPGVCLPVVELTTEPGTADNPNMLTDEEIAIMEGITEKNLPCVIRYTSNGINTIGVFTFGANRDQGVMSYTSFSAEGNLVYIVNLPGMGWGFYAVTA